MKDLFDIFFPFIIIFSPILLILMSFNKKQNFILSTTKHLLTCILKLLSLILFGSYEHISKIMKEHDKED